MANRKRLCSYCDRYFPRGEMIITPKNQAFCCEDHQIKYAREAGARLRNYQAKEQRKQVKANDRTSQFALTKKEAQSLANLIDQFKPCICCDEPRGNAQFCGGHFRTAGGNPEIALDLRNIHGQRNYYCNQYKSGNIAGDKHSKGYKQGLIDRYGQDYLDWLESYHPPTKFTCEELIKLRAVYAAEKRYIKKHGQPSRNWRSLDYELRDLIKEQERRAA